MSGTYVDPASLLPPATLEEIRANVEKLGKPPLIPKALLEAMQRELLRRFREEPLSDLTFLKQLVDTAPLGPPGVMLPTFPPRLPPAEYATFGVPYTLTDLGWRMPERKK